MGVGESSRYKIELQRKEKFYYGGERILGSVFVKLAEKDCDSALYLAYATRARYHKPTKSKNPSLITKWLYCAFYKIAKKMDAKNSLVDRDTYKFYFSIPIPNGVPPFICSNKNIALVSHYLQLSTNRKLKNPDKMHTEEIIVYPSVSILNNPASDEITGSAESKQNCLSVTLDRGAYVPGDFIIIQYQVHNEKRNVLKSLSFQFVQTYSVEKVSEERVAFEILDSGINDSTVKRISNSTVIQIPAFAFPPTYNFTGGIGDEVHINITYFVRVRLAIKGFFNPDIVLSFPVMIGTEPRSSAVIPNKSVADMMKADNIILNDNSRLCYCDYSSLNLNTDRNANDYESDLDGTEEVTGGVYEDLTITNPNNHTPYETGNRNKILDAAEDVLSNTKNKIANIISHNPISNSFRNATRSFMNSSQAAKAETANEDDTDVSKDSSDVESKKSSFFEHKKNKENLYELVDKVTIVTKPTTDNHTDAQKENDNSPRVIRFTYKNENAEQEIMRGIIDGTTTEKTDEKEDSNSEYI